MNTELNDERVIAYLHEKREYHRREMLRYEGLIAGFTGVSLPAIIPPVNKVVKAEVPRKYKPEMRWQDKIIYVMDELYNNNNITAPTIKQIAHNVKQHEPKIEMKEITKGLYSPMASLIKAGQVLLVREENSNHYKLVE